MTDSKSDKEWVKRAGVRRDSEGRGDRRNLSKELFPDKEITHKDVGLKQERRKDNRRSGKDRRD